MVYVIKACLPVAGPLLSKTCVGMCKTSLVAALQAKCCMLYKPAKVTMLEQKGVPTRCCWSVCRHL